MFIVSLSAAGIGYSRSLKVAGGRTNRFCYDSTTALYFSLSPILFCFYTFLVIFVLRITLYCYSCYDVRHNERSLEQSMMTWQFHVV